MNIENTYKELKTRLSESLSVPGCKPEETPDSTIRALWLTAAGMPCSPVEASKHQLQKLSGAELRTLNDLIEKRLDGIPLAYLTGKQNFMGIEFIANNKALIPRKETEILCRKALDIADHIAKENRPVKVLDMCCGSGNIGLSLAKYNPDVIVFAGDITAEAVELCKQNINQLSLSDRVSVTQSDMFMEFRNESFIGNTDLIACNPPYISSFKVPKMEKEISMNEPSEAFDGGMFGLGIIRRLIRESTEFLKPGMGYLTFEVGAGQGEMIKDLCAESGLYNNIECVKDENDVGRVLSMRAK